jgi:hypothetical protein
VELVTGQRRYHFEVATNIREAKQHFKSTVGVTEFFLKRKLQDYAQYFVG